MNIESVYQIASGGLAEVPYDWMSATRVRAFIFEDPALVWLDYHGEANGFTKDSSPYEFPEFIFEKGRGFERKWMSEMAGEAERVCAQEFEVRDANKLKQTLELMGEQVPLIAGAALWWAPEKVFGVPDLLAHTAWLRERFPELGIPDDLPTHYVVLDMKFTTKLDSSQKRISFANFAAQIRIYSFIVGQLQEIMPPYGFLVCRDRIANPLEVNTRSSVGAPLDDDLKVIRDKYLDIKLNGADYRPWTHEDVCINLSNDQDDPWHTAKREIARDKIPGGDTCLVYEVGRKQKEDLAKRGFPTRESLLDSDPNEIPLEACHSLGVAKCPRIRAVLRANRSGEVTPASIGRVPAAKPFEFYVDFETFNNLNVDFDRQWPTLDGCEMIFMVGVGWEENDAWNFELFTANEESHDSEYEMLERLQRFLHHKTDNRLTDSVATVLYHWTSAEVSQLKRSADRHGLDAQHTLRKLPWYDLHKEVFLTEPVGVPDAWNYGLKEVATALKVVEWPGELGDGLRATVAGWKAYRTESPLESVEMKTVAEYNEVDCLALYEIVRWMRGK